MKIWHQDQETLFYIFYNRAVGRDPEHSYPVWCLTGDPKILRGKKEVGGWCWWLKIMFMAEDWWQMSFQKMGINCRSRGEIYTRGRKLTFPPEENYTNLLDILFCPGKIDFDFDCSDVCLIYQTLIFILIWFIFVFVKLLNIFKRMT